MGLILKTLLRNEVAESTADREPSALKPPLRNTLAEESHLAQAHAFVLRWLASNGWSTRYKCLTPRPQLRTALKGPPFSELSAASAEAMSSQPDFFLCPVLLPSSSFQGCQGPEHSLMDFFILISTSELASPKTWEQYPHSLYCAVSVASSLKGEVGFSEPNLGLVLRLQLAQVKKVRSQKNLISMIISATY